jgi:hypothetical protein
LYNYSLYLKGYDLYLGEPDGLQVEGYVGRLAEDEEASGRLRQQVEEQLQTHCASGS